MVPTNVAPDLDHTEALLWTILNRFESLAAEQYAASAPALLTDAKHAIVMALRSRARSGDDLAGTQLESPVAALVRTATSTDEAHVLVTQGLLLELIGEAIYRRFGDSDATSDATRALCVLGSAASNAARSLIPQLLVAQIGRGEMLLQSIMMESGELLRSLDALGEAIDANFAERFDFGFADLMGDVAAELIAVCLELDVDRRKLVAFLTGALMGL